MTLSQTDTETPGAVAAGPDAGEAIRFGVRPTINAIGTSMLLISFLILAVAVALPRLLGRREEETVLIGRETA